MDLLNSYCIEEVCKYLDIQSQINMAIVSPDFLHALQPLWQKSHKIVELHKILRQANSDILIKSIKETVEKLILRGYIRENEACLKKILSVVNFPKATTVKIGFWDTGKMDILDHLLLLIVHSCPNLTELHLNRNFTGKYICQLEKLERISLKYSPHIFEYRHTEEIFKSLKLKKVSLTKSVDYSDEIRLTIAGGDTVHNLVKCKTIEELYLGADFLEQEFLEQMIVNLKNLRKVAFTGCEGPYVESEMDGPLNDEEPSYNLPIENLQGNICGLVKGVITNVKWMPYDTREEAFLNLMSRLTNLELLSFSSAGRNLDFLRRLIQRLDKNLKIDIYWADTDFTGDELHGLSSFSNVKRSAYKHDSFEETDIELLLKI